MMAMEAGYPRGEEVVVAGRRSAGIGVVSGARSAYRSPGPCRTTVFGGGRWTGRASTWANGFALCHLKTTRIRKAQLEDATAPVRQEHALQEALAQDDGSRPRRRAGERPDRPPLRARTKLERRYVGDITCI